MLVPLGVVLLILGICAAILFAVACLVWHRFWPYGYCNTHGRHFTSQQQRALHRLGIREFDLRWCLERHVMCHYLDEQGHAKEFSFKVKNHPCITVRWLPDGAQQTPTRARGQAVHDGLMQIDREKMKYFDAVRWIETWAKEEMEP